MNILSEDVNRIHIFYTPLVEGLINIENGKILFKQLNNSLKFVSVQHSDVLIALKPESKELIVKYYDPTINQIDNIAWKIIEVVKGVCAQIIDGQGQPVEQLKLS